jgi:hypothetical protein
MNVDQILTSLESNISNNRLTLLQFEQLLMTLGVVRRMIRREYEGSTKDDYLNRLAEIREEFNSIINRKRKSKDIEDLVSAKYGNPTSMEIEMDVYVWAKGLTEAKKKTQKKDKTFPQYFAPEYCETLPDALKQEFSTETGKWIRLMVIALEKKGLLTIGVKTELFRAIENCFERKIGSYESIFSNFIYDETAHAIDFTGIEKRLERVLLKINK